MKATISLREFIEALEEIEKEYPPDANPTVYLGNYGMSIKADRYNPGEWEENSAALAKAKPLPGGLGFYTYQAREGWEYV